MKTTAIRQKFLEFFEQNGHEIVASSPLVPGNDPTLLFTNAGMVQFKDVFLGTEKRDNDRATTSQRCVRAGGKHNDLENVGYTARHHTFFEMLGNFSFGDYFKRDAIHFAWSLLTEVYGLPKEKLWVTVFEEDDEAADIWISEIGVAADRVTRIGAKDNFWQMGDTGPCGPCSEIFYDHGPEIWGGPPGTPEEDGDRFVEIWNLVFMQFNRSADGSLEPLPKPSVDTGMGLERIAAVLQGVHSNYEIDLFQNLIQEAARVTGVDDVEDKSLRVIADHIRSTAFLILDGVLPSNEGRGYVLRRIIRRAIRHGYQLGCKQAFMHRIVPALVDEMGDAYPDLVQQQSRIERVLRAENEKFNETLEQGIRILNQEIETLEGKEIPGNLVFKLYDTYGFPADLTADVARERNLVIDQAGFDTAMEAQRDRARAASQFVAVDQLDVSNLEKTEFIGYDTPDLEARILAIFVGEERTDEIVEGQQGVIVLDRTPFYAESGGQVGDNGRLSAEQALFQVDDTRYLADKITGHFGRVATTSLSVGQSVRAEITQGDRTEAANNHSATHLLHAALKDVLGGHVQQKGSLVAPNRLRFDFSHFEPVTDDELQRISRHVNQCIRANHAVKVQQMELEKAKAEGAEALFGEKYANIVRTIKMGESFELCGGTHVEATGNIGQFVIVSETGIAAGVRRIEALSGISAEHHVEAQLESGRSIAQQLKVAPVDVAEKLQGLLESQKQLQRQIQQLQAKLASGAVGGAGDDIVEEINGIKLARIRLDDADAKAMRLAVDQWKQKIGSGIVVVAGARDSKVTLIAGVTSDLTDSFQAGSLISAVAPHVDGKGGGKPELAQGGGTNAGGIDKALSAVSDWLGACD
ncbi:MAG: alanine--tRNA ligase [Pseudomonadota bacterium]